MDGKGRAIDNIFIERLWRTVKYEHVYLRVVDDGVQLYEGLQQYFYFYNQQRPHQPLGYQTPADCYLKMPENQLSLICNQHYIKIKLIYATR